MNIYILGIYLLLQLLFTAREPNIQNVSNSYYSINPDSSLSIKIQLLINKNKDLIESYNKSLYEIVLYDVKIDSLNKISKIYHDSITYYNQIISSYLELVTIKNISKNEIKLKLDTIYKKVNRASKIIENNIDLINELNNTIVKYQQLHILEERQYNLFKNEVYNLLQKDTSTQKLVITYNNVEYVCIISNFIRDNLKVVANTSNNLMPLSNKWIEDKKMFCIFNAGMFKEDGSALGLLIENYSLVSNIDSSKEKKYGNFYLYPNGVFFVDKFGKYSIASTTYFIDSLLNKTKFIKYATQSGPMLVINNKIHKEFKFNSTSKFIRNAVGVNEMLSNSRSYLVITQEPVNLYDLSIFFKDVLQCKFALYLDGAISKVYYKYSNETHGNLNGNLGPVITISRK